MTKAVLLAALSAGDGAVLVNAAPVLVGYIKFKTGGVQDEAVVTGITDNTSSFTRTTVILVRMETV